MGKGVGVGTRGQTQAGTGRYGLGGGRWRGGGTFGNTIEHVLIQVVLAKLCAVGVRHDDVGDLRLGS